MSFNNAIPQPGDDLSVSQGDLLNNNIGLNSIFGIDHYAFINNTSSKGFHNTVTTPLIVGSAHPATTTNPIFYAMNDSTALAALTPIQYSRGANNQTPTPLTSLQSSSTPIVLAPSATTQILDFTGLTRVFATLYAGNFNGTTTNRRLEAFVMWSNPNFTITSYLPSSALTATSSTSVLLLENSSTTTNNDIYWTLKFHRIEV